MPGLRLDNVSFIIVDDSDHMRRLLRIILHALGVQDIREAADGSDALELMRGGKIPDILLTNWNMAPLDGIELARHIRHGADSPNRFLPIIMISGYSELRRVMAARDAGINEFLVKPVSVKAVYGRIAAVIERPRLFVRTKSFFGPDRRRRDGAPFDGRDRRTRANMTQAEINTLFNPDDPPA